MFCDSLEDIKAPKEPKDWPLMLKPNLLKFEYENNQDTSPFLKE